ncbi:MAG: AraC family transcriptional regulator [Clostridiales bacterium]|nr:AraC family transcriptional regulator [Clostridiales bacterium]
MKNITFEIASRSHYVMVAHDIHTEIELYYLTRGERLYFVENRTYRLGAGCVIFINSDRIHKTSALGNQPHERMLLEVHPNFLAECSKQFGLNFDYLLNQTAVIVTPDNPFSAVIHSHFEEIRRLMENKPFGFEAETYCDVLKIFLSLQRSLSLEADVRIVNNPKHQKIYEVAEYISKNMATITTLDGICTQFYISKFYLGHSFKAVTGLSVMAFLNATRVQRARVLLSETNQSMAQIAKSVGLVSVSRFTDVFKRIEGITPHEYRRQPYRHPWHRESPADDSPGK